MKLYVYRVYRYEGTPARPVDYILIQERPIAPGGWYIDELLKPRLLGRLKVKK